MVFAPPCTCEVGYIANCIKEMGPGPYEIIKVESLIGSPEWCCNCGLVTNTVMRWKRHKKDCPVRWLLERNQNQAVLVADNHGQVSNWSGSYFQEA